VEKLLGQREVLTEDRGISKLLGGMVAFDRQANRRGLLQAARGRGCQVSCLRQHAFIHLAYRPTPDCRAQGPLLLGPGAALLVLLVVTRSWSRCPVQPLSGSAPTLPLALKPPDSPLSPPDAPDFDWVAYLANYPELLHPPISLNYGKQDAWHHYESAGRAQGRVAARLTLRLRYTTHQGLTNQLLGHLAAFMIAQEMGAEVVMSPAVSKNSFNMQEQVWQWQSTESVFDLGKMTAYWRDNGLVIHKVSPHSWAIRGARCALSSLSLLFPCGVFRDRGSWTGCDVGSQKALLHQRAMQHHWQPLWPALLNKDHHVAARPRHVRGTMAVMPLLHP